MGSLLLPEFNKITHFERRKISPGKVLPTKIFGELCPLHIVSFQLDYNIKTHILSNLREFVCQLHYYSQRVASQISTSFSRKPDLHINLSLYDHVLLGVLTITP